ncbi:MAG: DNA/RNA helicase domain-containing protein [Fimbriimonadales bacterium]
MKFSRRTELPEIGRKVFEPQSKSGNLSGEDIRSERPSLSDDCLRDPKPPIEHVALFDEAQRAWDRQQTANFMRRKKGVADFDVSESAFLISCLDRHDDWAVVVCLVGQGQEINTGEAGVSLWIEAIQEDFPEWKVYASKHLTTLDYAAGALLDQFPEGQFTEIDELHLSVSMRSFRSERVSEFVQHLLAVDLDRARTLYADLAPSYGIVLTRDLERGKQWVRERARGTERT